MSREENRAVQCRTRAVPADDAKVMVTTMAMTQATATTAPAMQGGHGSPRCPTTGHPSRMNAAARRKQSAAHLGRLIAVPLRPADLRAGTCDDHGPPFPGHVPISLDILPPPCSTTYGNSDGMAHPGLRLSRGHVGVEHVLS